VTQILWAEGVSVPYLGGTLLIALTSHGLPHTVTLGAAPKTLHLNLPQSASAEQIREATHRWLQNQAARMFEERCTHFAPLMRVRVQRLSLSAARTRWGSASGDGSIRLNWRLIHLPPSCIDYVVIHELAHLREMNHSPRFWAVVRSVMPNYETVRRHLKSAPMLTL
jgi:predicted metal-dependent hydrolase